VNRHGNRTLRNAAIGAALALGVGAALLARSPRAKEQQPPAEEVELKDGFLKAVRPPLPHVQTIARRPAKADSPSQPPPSETMSSTQTTPEDEAKARLELDRRREQNVIAQFDGDAPAIPASKEMERHLTGAFEAQRGRGVKVNRIECHNRICRLELMFDTVEADIVVLRDLFVRNLAPEIANYGQSIAPSREYLPNGQVKTTMYVAREGAIEVVD
jgi:hypothetical protein